MAPMLDYSQYLSPNAIFVINKFMDNKNKKNDKVKNGKMTLDKLARMVAGGFDRTATKDEMNSRFDFVETRLKDVEKKVDKLDYQVDESYDILKRFEENDILNLQKRVQILEKAVRSLAKQPG